MGVVKGIATICLGKKVDMTSGEAIECVIQALHSAGFGVLTDIDVTACKWPIARVLAAGGKFREISQAGYNAYGGAR